MGSTRELEFFFIGSTCTHLSVHRAEAAARAAGVALVWRPFSVRTLMREQANVPFADKPVKMAYMWRELERRARRFGVPFDGIAPYPIDADELANRVATLAAMQGWCPDFARCIEAADGDAVRAEYAQQTDRARAPGVFGSPSFVHGREVFWGDDRLDDAIAWAAAPPRD